ncbi:hypothetical protein JBKA6_0327 [Ichthyobacterium seriolicida]|uniref:SusD/RagB family nutrient-binding outer membrane lipoprotein n=1 Tax=Ichthyobacterium seriolicida TaxID=242600 RepID=A0A1J1E2T6_9FLAO|nr:hypothetical protein JBKA6_0327 [Ichthyobacterium seriolicida]
MESTDESNYNISKKDIAGEIFIDTYRKVLKNLDQAKEFLKTEDVSAEAKKVRTAILDINSVFAYSRLVETFGDIPYSEALDVKNLTPKYDDAKTVYKDLISKLDMAIKGIGSSTSGAYEHDNMYTTVSGWKKFAASLMLRMGMVLADVDQTYAKSIVVKAHGYGLFTSNTDNAYYKYRSTSPHQNLVYVGLVASKKNEYVMAKTLVDILKDFPNSSSNTTSDQDPRLSRLCTAVEGSSEYSGAEIGAKSQYNRYSHITDQFKVSDRAARVLDYSEVELLLAEACERNFLSGSAKDHYDKGVTASIVFFGGSEQEATTYLGKADAQYTTSGNTSSDWKQKIGTQLWIAMYNRGASAWLHWRRLDFPQLVAPAGNPHGMTAPPYRLTYPVSEQSLNGDSYKKASDAIGGDKLSVKLFWDKH